MYFTFIVHTHCIHYYVRTLSYYLVIGLASMSHILILLYMYLNINTIIHVPEYYFTLYSINNKHRVIICVVTYGCYSWRIMVNNKRQ